VNELLGALGLAWPRLLAYPGGLAALLAAWLLNRWNARVGAGGAPVQPVLGFGDLLPPLLLLSLLPLPPARSFPYGLDLPTALALAEWPRLRVLAGRGGLAPERLRALVPAYALLLIGAGKMAAAAGSLELAALTRWPADWWARGVLLGGMLLWLAALPRLGAASAEAHWALRLRALGLLAIPAPALIGALAAALNPWIAPALLGWLLPPAALALLALGLAGLARGSLSMQHAARSTQH
jgi:hypothetical protein